MGGPGSGTFPDDGSAHRGGRKKRAAVAVSGSGVPVKPADLPQGVSDCWDWFAGNVEGIAFAQDSDAITAAAWLTWQQQEIRKAVYLSPCDDELTRQNLAVGRQLQVLWGQFGMTPRSRQILLVPKAEETTKDELEAMLDGDV